MKLQERQYLFAMSREATSVVEQQSVRPRPVVHCRDWQVQGQRGPNESVVRVVEPGI
jgi:hypothetical protein